MHLRKVLRQNQQGFEKLVDVFIGPQRTDAICGVVTGTATGSAASSEPSDATAPMMPSVSTLARDFLVSPWRLQIQANRSARRSSLRPLTALLTHRAALRGTQFECRNQRMPPRLVSGLEEEPCRRVMSCAMARPERLRFTSVLTCRGCLPRQPTGRCHGLSACCQRSFRLRQPTQRGRSLRDLSPPRNRAWGRHVAALLRTLAFDDPRRARP
jgi:hypothetical protein